MSKTYGDIKHVTYIRTYDGDTSFFNITNAPAVFGHDIGVRVRGVDTPEIRSKDCERSLAYEAKTLVETLLKKSTTITLLEVGRDKYFRVLANISYDEKDLSLTLLDNHLAVQYDGGKKATVDWCYQQTLFHNTEYYKTLGETTDQNGDL